MGGVILFLQGGVFNLFLPKPIPHLQYRVCGGGSGIRVESSGYVFSPALASIERTGIVGLLLSDFHTAIIASASNHESAGGGGGDRKFFSQWVLNLKRFVSNKCGWAKGKGRGGGQGLEFMHNVYDATYLHRPTCSILQSIGSCLVWIYVFGGGGGVWYSNKEEPSGLVLAIYSLCRPFTFMYVSTYQPIPNQIQIQTPPLPLPLSLPSISPSSPKLSCYFLFSFIKKNTFPPCFANNTICTITYWEERKGRKEKEKKIPSLMIWNNFILITYIHTYIFVSCMHAPLKILLFIIELLPPVYMYICVWYVLVHIGRVCYVCIFNSY